MEISKKIFVWHEVAAWGNDALSLTSMEEECTVGSFFSIRDGTGLFIVLLGADNEWNQQGDSSRIILLGADSMWDWQRSRRGWEARVSIMSEEVADLMKHLKFTEEESEDISPPRVITEDDVMEMDKWIVARIIGYKRIDSELPLGYMKVETAKKIGNRIGKTIATDTRSGEGRMGDYLRVKVEIDCFKPLRRCAKMGVLANGEPRKCLLKYEQLPSFCHRCNIIGYVLTECPGFSEQLQQPLQFGEWLRVSANSPLSDRGTRSPLGRPWMPGRDLLHSTSSNREDDLDPTNPTDPDSSLSRSFLERKNGETSKGRRKVKRVNRQVVYISYSTLNSNVGTSEKKDPSEIPEEFAVKRSDHFVGLMMLWKEGLDVSLQSFSNLHIDVEVFWKEQKFWFTGFYGHSGWSDKKHNWEMISHLAYNSSLPWSGWFSWASGTCPKTFVCERIDRFIAKIEWRLMFPECYVDTVPMASSDHSAILMSLEGTITISSPMRDYFKFDACWAMKINAEILCIGFGRTMKTLSQSKENRVYARLDSGPITDEFCELRRKALADLKDVMDKEDVLLEDIFGVTTSYFFSLFRSSEATPDEEILQAIDRCVSPCDNEMLCRDFSAEEVTIGFSQVNPSKAPSFDGLPGQFFRSFWNIVGCDFVNLYLSLLNGMMDFNYVNRTIIVLIPKVSSSKLMKQFRPISLCSVIYKVVSKAIVNRLKPLMHVCVVENQCAFVPGRRIFDNFLVAHELIHYLKGSKNGPNKGVAIKLDKEKAYDRVEWGFLLDVMIRMGFSSSFVNLIRKCISTVSFQGLSTLLLKAQRRNEIKGIRASMRGPRITHLLFADDSLLFVKNSAAEVRKVKRVVEATDPGNYLSLPLAVGKGKRAAFNFVRDKTEKRIQGWTKRLLGLLMTSSHKLDPIGGPGNKIPEVGRWLHGIRFVNPKNLEEWGSRILDCLKLRFLGIRFGDLFKMNIFWLSRPKKLSRMVFFWRVGMDSKARMFEDNWGDTSPIRWYERYMDHAEQSVRVADFMIPMCARWDEPKVVGVLLSEDASQVLKTLIASIWGDRLLWGHHSSRFYSAKSGYNWLKIKNSSVMVADAIPMGSKIKQANLVDGICPLCLCELESIMHAIKDCPKVKTVLLMSSLSPEIVDWRGNSSIMWLSYVQSKLNGEGFDLFLVLLWNLCNRRNYFVHNGDLQSDRDIIINSSNLIGEYRIDSNYFGSISDKVVFRRSRCWIKPAQDEVKINVDVAYCKNSRVAVVGIVARDSHRMVIGGLTKKIDHPFSVESTEAVAFTEGILLASENGWNNVIIEGDAISIVYRLSNQVTKNLQDISTIGLLLNEARQILANLHFVKVHYVCREANRVAHSLAQWALSNNNPVCFFR
ncbi:hypothetical protein F3Y22_tig00110387pilonHSYRG00987 [Hibiscus syriacus]|uniref:Reverse transcriptase n=1 Tax=Hibiscus syriacus TaxID=106335 RepID=A0A6A3AVQ0_HIBSY|nr:hypothetical protein F3Y22_tig00110387pilonHSYRG00987 [Hibiscus syriacus]